MIYIVITYSKFRSNGSYRVFYGQNICPGPLRRIHLKNINGRLWHIPKIWIIECLSVNDTISTSWKTLCTQDMMSLVNHRNLSNMGKPLLVTPLYDSLKFCLWLKPSPNLSKYLGFGSVSSWNSAEYPTSLGRVPHWHFLTEYGWRIVED